MQLFPEGREVQTSFKIITYRAGLCQVLATFRSDVISVVRGYGSLKISEKTESKHFVEEHLTFRDFNCVKSYFIFFWHKLRGGKVVMINPE